MNILFFHFSSTQLLIVQTKSFQSRILPVWKYSGKETPIFGILSGSAHQKPSRNFPGTIHVMYVKYVITAKNYLFVAEYSETETELEFDI